MTRFPELAQIRIKTMKILNYFLGLAECLRPKRPATAQAWGLSERAGAAALFLFFFSALLYYFSNRNNDY